VIPKSFNEMTPKRHNLSLRSFSIPSGAQRIVETSIIIEEMLSRQVIGSDVREYNYQRWPRAVDKKKTMYARFITSNPFYEVTLDV